MYKLIHFNLTTSPLYPVKLEIAQNSRTFTEVRSVEPNVPDFLRKSFNFRFSPCLLEHFFSSLPTENLLHSRGFHQKFIFKLNMVNFNVCDVSQLWRQQAFR